MIIAAVLGGWVLAALLVAWGWSRFMRATRDQF
jgi:DNA-binding transcriptional regulator of glucitol operon